jgi:hypothetical protein
VLPDGLPKLGRGERSELVSPFESSQGFPLALSLAVLLLIVLRHISLGPLLQRIPTPSVLQGARLDALLPPPMALACSSRVRFPVPPNTTITTYPKQTSTLNQKNHIANSQFRSNESSILRMKRERVLNLMLHDGMLGRNKLPQLQEE